MLHLIVRLQGAAYALEAARIVEVLPLLRVTPTPGGPNGAAGTIVHRGALTPVADLSALLLGRPFRRRLGGRIVLMRTATGRVAGLIAEHATETLRMAPERFAPSDSPAEAAGLAGEIALCERGVVRRLDLERAFAAAFDEPAGRRAA